MIKGPNQVWSIDGHDKLSRFGFQIYGAIDAYSRYMIWYFVGHSNRTAVSVNKQFLSAIRSHNTIPQLVRSDKGTETTLLCNSQLVLHRAVNHEVPIREVYSYRTSTKNQRIESWWNLLANAQTDTWREIFNDLEMEGYFNGGALDIIAMQFVYMRMITDHIHTFVQIHNCHRIRRQRKREHYLPSGKPIELYNYPPTGIRDHGLVPDKLTLEALDLQMSPSDLDEYLTAETSNLYETLLVNGNRAISYSFNEQHREAYIFLRTQLACYPLEITTLPTPAGAERWIEQYGPTNTIDEKDIEYLDQNAGTEWNFADLKFPLSNEIGEFDESEIIDYDNISLDGNEESDNDGIVLNIFP